MQATIIGALVGAAAALAPAAADDAAPRTEAASRTIAAPPATLGLDPFYTKYLDAGGIPVTGSDAVPDLAIQVAHDLVMQMLAHRPDLLRAMAARGQRVAIMGLNEGTTDLPEQRDWKKPALDDPRLTRCERKHYDVRIGAMTDAQYWNKRARGMGGILVSGGTEGVLGWPGGRYYGQNILVHEFSHSILSAVEDVDRPLYARVQKAYADAMASGRWKGEYASTTIQEYWAVGTQIWFNTAKVQRFDGRTILSHQDLAAYDPALYRVLGAVYGRTHHLRADVYYMHPARVPKGPLPENTAEVC